MNSYLVNNVNDFSPPSIFLFNTTPPLGGIINDAAPILHWRLIDFGWGIIPDTISILNNSTPLAEYSDLQISYSPIFTYDNRLVIFYDIVFEPSSALPPGTNNFILTFEGLVGLHGDSDADGWPDPQEISTNPSMPDTDTDGLLDSLDPCPLNPDIDDDGILDGADPDMNGDGAPDISIINLGFGSFYSLSSSFSIQNVEFPQPILGGFQSNENHIDNRSIVNVLLSEEIPNSLIPIFENTACWVVQLVPQLSLVNVQSVTASENTLQIQLDANIPANVTAYINFTVPFYSPLTSWVLKLSTINLPWPFECTCPSIDAGITDPWNCCEDNNAFLHFVCGNCPYSLYVFIARGYPEKEENNFEDCNDESSTSGGMIWDYSYWNLTPYVRAYSLFNCPEWTVKFPLSRCYQWDIQFELICYDWLGQEKSTQEAWIHSPMPDTNPPTITQFDWDIIDPGEQGGSDCYIQMNVSATDECLRPYFEITKFPSNECLNLGTSTFTKYWDICVYDDETCEYCSDSWRINVGDYCCIKCLQVTVYDTCGNWSNKSMSESELPKARSVTMQTPAASSEVLINWQDNSSSYQNPHWRQYENLPKTIYNPAKCFSFPTEPNENGEFITVEAKVTNGSDMEGTPLPGVAVTFYQVDPWHRPCNFPDPQIPPPGPGVQLGEFHNRWNKEPNPLWDNDDLSKELIWANSDIFWIQSTDAFNDNKGASCFTPKCTLKSSYPCRLWITAYTDCDGIARAQFWTSTYGGDNHIVVADVCGDKLPNPSVSETVEIWRKANVLISSMERANGQKPPLGPLPPGTVVASFQGPYKPDVKIVESTFQDCFFEVIP